MYWVKVPDVYCIVSDTIQLQTTLAPVVTNSPLAKSICSGESTSIPLTSNMPGTDFSWTAIGSSPLVTGYSPGTGDTINQNLINSGSVSETVTYTITPAIGGCVGDSVQYVVTVTPGDSVKVTISSSSDSVCEGTQVTFLATPTNGGFAPSYQWKVNGMDTGTNDSVFSYSTGNGDTITCVLTSSNSICTTNNPATSNTITMTVYPNLPVSISITPSANPVCGGIPVTFTATPTNGGSSPGYQWQVNAINAGTNNVILTYTPVAGDVVTCILTSNEDCVTGNPATSNPITMSVGEQPVVSFSICFDTVTTLNAKPFKLKGGIPLGGTYSGPGVDQITGYFNPAMASLGTKPITYSYTNMYNCSNNSIRSIIVVNPASFTCGESITDIRDYIVYPTVQIGSQCWLAVNLNHGQQISGSSAQRDNCLVEKYCYNNLPANCVQRGALYQWDELMCYEDAEENQGLCPPGWHVPSEAEWNTIFANWTNNAFAGAPLKYSGYSGFNAFLNGAGFFNKGWWFGDFAAFFWSSTSHGPQKAWAHGMNEYDYSVSYYPSYQANAFSVRCLRD
ncbi:MAG: FISUMP domain-containing protein [Bacteroidota bacterium]